MILYYHNSVVGQKINSLWSNLWPCGYFPSDFSEAIMDHSRNKRSNI